MIKDIAAKISRYVDHPEPRAALAGKVALVVASNQPFYPLYLHWIAGAAAWPAWLTLLTTPVFLAVPALAKRNSLAGRALLPLIGTFNTVFCVKLFGTASGVELFLLPCLLLATVLFRPEERWKIAIVAALPFAAYFFIDERLGPPLMSTTEHRQLIAINGISVASLISLVWLMVSTMFSAQQTKQT